MKGALVGSAKYFREPAIAQHEATAGSKPQRREKLLCRTLHSSITP